MTPANGPTPDGPSQTAPELANAARNFRLRMAVIDNDSAGSVYIKGHEPTLRAG